MKHDFSSCPPEIFLQRNHFVTKGSSFASLCKPKSVFPILGWKCGHYSLVYADIFIQFLQLEIISDSVCESLCYYRHIPDLDLLEELKRLPPPLLCRGCTVGSSVIWYSYMAAQLPARSGLRSTLSAYCCGSTWLWLNPCASNSLITWAAYLLGGWFVSLTTSAPSALDPINPAHLCVPAELSRCHESDHAFARAQIWSWLIALCLNIKVSSVGSFFSTTKLLFTNVSVIQPSVMHAYQRESSPINNYCQPCAAMQSLCSIHSWCNSSQMGYFKCQLDAPVVKRNVLLQENKIHL